MTKNLSRALGLVAAAGLVASCTTSRSLPEDGAEPTWEQARRVEAEQEGHAVTAIAPKELPPVPRAEVAAARVPEGFRAEAVMRDLTYPTSLEFDDAGNVYVAEAGYAPLFRTQEDAAGPEGYEHVATSGPRRPIDVRFAPDGEALYVVDFGALAVFPAGAGTMARPFPGTGVLWRIVAAGAPAQSPPADLSPIPGRGRPAAGK